MNFKVNGRIPVLAIICVFLLLDLIISWTYLGRKAKKEQIRADEIEKAERLMNEYYKTNGDINGAVFFDKDAEAVNLIENGYDVNLKDSYGSSPLINAVKKQKIEIAGKLLEKGAFVNDTDKEGKTALFYLIPLIPENSDLIGFSEKLINNGANLNLSDKNGTSLFDYVEAALESARKRSLAEKTEESGTAPESQAYEEVKEVSPSEVFLMGIEKRIRK